MEAGVDVKKVSGRLGWKAQVRVRFRLDPNPLPNRFETNAKSGLWRVGSEPTPGFEPGTFSLPSGLRSLANSTRS